jgi:1-pyrroline-5-carboxylate dehydrogenase
VSTFRWLWKEVGKNLENYKGFPTLSGECGGKNFHLIHDTADIDSAAIATVRSAFEFCGQKCSACSRLYVSKAKWPQMRNKMLSILKSFKVASPLEFDATTSSVIDEKAFDRITSYIQHGVKDVKNTKLIAGGKYDKSIGYFIEPTIFETTDPNNRLLKEEIC